MANSADPRPPNRPAWWKWTICGRPLLASTINYMDRQTLANASVRITKEFFEAGHWPCGIRTFQAQF
jgi:hypothetical protein